MRKIKQVLILLVGLFVVSCYDDSELNKRVDDLERNILESVNQQVKAIEESIESLRILDEELESIIGRLIAEDKSHINEVDTLKSLDQSLDAKIVGLSLCVKREFSSLSEWVDSIYITIEKYNSILADLKEIKDLSASKYKELSEKVDASIISINSWVDEVLAGYYTSEEIDTKLQILRDDLEQLINDLLIVLREFSIYFDDFDIGILPGDTAYVNYTILGATDSTTVRVLTQNGWKAKVDSYGNNKGRITAIAPNPLTRDEIIVLVDDGNGRVIMTEVNFVKGMTIASIDTIKVSSVAGIISIPFSTNIDYHVSIPDEAQEWLSMVETKSLIQDTLTLAYSSNEDLFARSCVINVTDKNNKVLFSIFFIQLEQDGIWESLGIGQWFDMLSLTTSTEYGIQDVEVLYAEKFNRYRIKDPYANEEQIFKAWGPDWVGGEKSLFIDFWVLDNNTNIMWDKWWYPGILYDGVGTEIKAYVPSVLGSSFADEDAKSKFYEEKVVGFYPYWYIDGLGGFGTKYPCFLSLPGGPSLETWLKDNGIVS